MTSIVLPYHHAIGRTPRPRRPGTVTCPLPVHCLSSTFPLAFHCLLHRRPSTSPPPAQSPPFPRPPPPQVRDPRAGQAPAGRGGPAGHRHQQDRAKAAGVPAANPSAQPSQPTRQLAHSSSRTLPARDVSRQLCCAQCSLQRGQRDDMQAACAGVCTVSSVLRVCEGVRLRRRRRRACP